MSTADQRVTLITGTRKGIGRFLAEHYVRLGHQVAVWKLNRRELNILCIQ